MSSQIWYTVALSIHLREVLSTTPLPEKLAGKFVVKFGTLVYCGSVEAQNV